MQNQSQNLKSIIFDVLNQPKITLADEYIRANELIDILDTYFFFNIDDVASSNVRDMTLNDLSDILHSKIKKYKKYIKNEHGYFVDEEALIK